LSNGLSYSHTSTLNIVEKRKHEEDNFSDDDIVSLSSTPKKMKKARGIPIENQILEQLKNSEDEDDLFGRSIGMKLKTLVAQKKAKAKYLINELLYKLEFEE
jgi:hypothetical protein